jgi:hypothetical protein
LEKEKEKEKFTSLYNHASQTHHTTPHREPDSGEGAIYRQCQPYFRRTPIGRNVTPCEPGPTSPRLQTLPRGVVEVLGGKAWPSIAHFCRFVMQKPPHLQLVYEAHRSITQSSVTPQQYVCCEPVPPFVELLVRLRSCICTADYFEACTDRVTRHIPGLEVPDNGSLVRIFQIAIGGFSVWKV